MRRQVLLEVQVGHHNLRGWGEESTERVVKDNLATVLGVLETLLEDVLVDKLSHLRSGNEITFGKYKEFTQLRCDFLLSVEAVVLSTLLSLFTIGILLGILDLTDELGESLNFGAEGGDFGLNGFKRHYIFFTALIFKS
tara:strand:- start:2522 stop:2938 length:417 start_codon:yes stop_codon:yes gene_type:complete